MLKHAVSAPNMVHKESASLGAEFKPPDVAPAGADSGSKEALNGPGQAGVGLGGQHGKTRKLLSSMSHDELVKECKEMQGLDCLEESEWHNSYNNRIKADSGLRTALKKARAVNRAGTPCNPDKKRYKMTKPRGPRGPYKANQLKSDAVIAGAAAAAAGRFGAQPPSKAGPADEGASSASTSTSTSASKYRFPCLHCVKFFNHPSRLDRHNIIHTGVRSFKCVPCMKSFTRKDTLTRHQKEFKCLL